jgi:uncharacterized protein DUF3616
MKNPQAAMAFLVLAAAAATAAELGPVRRIAGGPFEASGAAPGPGGRGLLFVDDGRPDTVFWMDLEADGSSATAPTAIPLGVTVRDPEGITSDGTNVYIVGSQSQGGGHHAVGLVRCRLQTREHRASDVETLTDLGSLLKQHVPPLREAGGHKKGALDIEGLAWDPKGQRLLVGLRSPLEQGQALLVPLKLRDPRGRLEAANVEVGEPMRVALEGSGIRAIEADPDGGFWMIAGGVSAAGSSRLVHWDGKGSAVRVVTTFPDNLKPEGVVRTRVGGRPRTVVLCDTSRYFLMD